MKLFIDTGSVAEVEEIAALGRALGRDHQPVAPREGGGRSRRGHRAHLRAGGRADARPRSSPTTRARWSPRDARWRALDDRVVVKVPFSAEGLAATRELASDGIPVNETLVFSAAQALLTVEAGATYVSCFMGRLDDISVTSEDVVAEIVEALRPDREAQVLAASMRNPVHVVTAARLGCEVSTIPYKVFKQMLGHPLTEAGIAKFARRLEEPARVRRVAARAGRGERRREELARAPARVRRRMSVLNSKELADSPLADLHQIASELGVEGYRAMRKDDLIGAILGVSGGAQATATATPARAASPPWPRRRGGRR